MAKVLYLDTNDALLLAANERAKKLDCELTAEKVVSGKVSNAIIKDIANYDAVVVSCNWQDSDATGRAGNEGLDFANKLRASGYNKPVALYTVLNKNETFDKDNANITYINKNDVDFDFGKVISILEKKIEESANVQNNYDYTKMSSGRKL